MPPKKAGGSPIKKKTKDGGKAAAQGGDGNGGTGGVGGAGGLGDGALGSGQDNDEMDAYHEPVSRSAALIQLNAFV